MLATCSGTASGPGTGAVVAAGATARPATPAPTTPISVSESAYGHLVLRTTAGARCTVEVHVGPPQYGDVPPAAAAAGIANPSGVLTITYPAPHLPAGPGWHEVTCGTGSSSADFTIPSDGISATRFTARIRVANIGDQLPGVTARLDASLAPARDLDVAALKRTLVSEWGLATRGLSTLDLLGDAPADIVITVVPARDTSVHVTASDGSQGIFLYVSDLQRTLTSDNLVAVALHELGHIWCCRGPDSSSGHWATPVADPLLQGVDRYGLMNHPVDCVLFGTIESCPNRFSDRDLRSMGFTQIPPPPRNACIDSKNALLAQLATLKDRLAGAKAGLDATDASLKTLSAQLVALETQYPGGMPPAVYQTYTALIDRYNGTLVVERTQVAAYNGLVTQSNGLVDQAKQLLC
ncbi:MAG: hypothetical protein ABJB39_10685 [Chloroflexota bacterium]